MIARLQIPLFISLLARELGLEVLGPDVEIHGICALDQCEPNCLTFSRRAMDLSASPSAAVIVPIESTTANVTTILRSSNPRLDFVRALDRLGRSPGFVPHTAPAQIHSTVTLGRNAMIGKGVVIGEGTVMYHNVVIADGVRIGRHCLIKSGAVIGEEGFGFERLPDGTPLRMQQLGSVIIGDHVEVGSHTTICRGSLTNTIVHDHVKIDDHVHIAHNCEIHSNAIITACTELSGGVHLEKGVWMAPNSAVLQKVQIGENAMVGIGAVVCRNVPPRVTVFGNPARPIPKMTR